MSLKYAYNGNEEIDTLFNKVELKQLSFDPASCQNIAILLKHHAKCIDQNVLENTVTL